MIPRAPLAAARLGFPPRALLALPRRRVPSQTARQQCRHSSSSRPSHTSNFYKTFGRPIFKVSLSAIFVYQLVYWAWVKLEQDEIREEVQAEIADLEAQVESLQASRPAPKQRK